MSSSTIDSLLEKGWMLANSQHAQIKSKEIVRELNAFLDRLPPVVSLELERAARDGVLAIVNKLKGTECL